MPTIPFQVFEDEQSRLLSCHLQRIGRGKVRHSFELTADSFAQYASDSVSVFDVVLPATVRRKGESLTATTAFWMSEFFSEFPNHLLAYGSAIDAHLPEPVRARPEIQKRTFIVHKCNPFKVECVVRGYLTGTGLKDYNRTGVVCGHRLPSGLHDGSQLPEPIFTPATKAEAGHDLNITEAEAGNIIGQSNIVLLRDWSLEIYTRAAAYARENGIIICDTKFEYGVDSNGVIRIIDEMLTFDSSRNWLASDYVIAQTQNKAPKGYDKQPIRDYMDSLSTPFFEPGVENGKRLKFSQFGPTEEQVKWAHRQRIPDEVLEDASTRCVEVVEKLARRSLNVFQRDTMGIAAA